MARLRYPQSTFEKRSLAARRGQATRARREALYATHPKAVVDAGWAKVRGRVVQTRELWFQMMEAEDVFLARGFQQLLIQALGLKEPTYSSDWRSPEWEFAWY